MHFQMQRVRAGLRAFADFGFGDADDRVFAADVAHGRPPKNVLTKSTNMSRQKARPEWEDAVGKLPIR